MESTWQIAELSNIAGFMTNDRDFWVTSRFERLHLINLLAIQQRLSRLDHEINSYLKYEEYVRGVPDTKACDPPKRSSKEVLTELENTIKAYGIKSALIFA